MSTPKIETKKLYYHLICYIKYEKACIVIYNETLRILLYYLLE